MSTGRLRVGCSGYVYDDWVGRFYPDGLAASRRLAWYAERFPGVMRGLDSYSYKKAPHLSEEQRKSFARLEHVAIARPHFLALGLDMLPSHEAAGFRIEGLPIVAWTVRSPEEWDAVRDGCDNLIFEGFSPTQE